MTTAPQRGMEDSSPAASCAPVGVDFVPGVDWFSGPREPFGAESLRVAVGPLTFGLEGLARDQADLLRSRFRTFVEEGTARPGLDLSLRLTRAGVPAFLALPSGRHEVYRMGRRSRDGAQDVWSYEFAGTLSMSRRRAELALVEASGPLFDRGLENYLRTLTASFILGRGGLLVHGSGVVRGGRAHVFFGPSGSGKTTVTHQSPRDIILSDDLTLVVAQPEGFRAAGIPFGMAHHHVPDTTESFPIASLCRLVQSPETRRERLEGALALAELASCLPFVMEDRAEAARALDNAGRLLDRVAAWHLFFRKDDSFWSVIEEP
jgi:hypothetical protein